MIIKNISLEEIQFRVESLKENATPEELKFIEILKSNKIDFEFQYPIDAGASYYIADFYFPKYKNIIELDGYYHFTPEGKEKDKKRDLFLMSKKYKVIHIINSNIYKFDFSEITKVKYVNKNNKPTKATPKKKPKIQKQADKMVSVKKSQATHEEKQAKLLKLYKLQYPYLFK